MRRITALFVLLVGASPARADDLWGNSFHLDAGQLALTPGVRAEPVNGYGGAVWPEFHVGMGFDKGWDVVAGLSYQVSLYYWDDEDIVWGRYGGPWFGSADLTVRHFTRDGFGWGIRLDSDPWETWGIGPEATWAWTPGPLRITFRPAYTYPLTNLGDPQFGTIWLGASLAWLPSSRVELFAEAEPWMLMELATYKGDDRFFAPTVEVPWQAGGWLGLGQAHRLGVAASWSPQSHFHPARNFTYTLRWRWEVN